MQTDVAVKYWPMIRTHQEMLLTNFSLLDMSSQQCQKETRLPLEGKNLNNSKVVYFILHGCLGHLMPKDEHRKAFEAWYPPRTVSDEMEFKKVCVSQIQKLQIQGKLPKNFMLNKAIIDQPTRVVEFLTYLSELTVRHVYLSRYAECLPQVSLFKTIPQSQNWSSDINRYYGYIMSAEPPEIAPQQLQYLYTHIEMLKQQLIKKRTLNAVPSFPHEQMISNMHYLQQIKKKLSQRIPKQFFSQNRAFDRTQILDRSQQIWTELQINKEDTEIQCTPNEILQASGSLFEYDKELLNWTKKLKQKVGDLQRQQIKELCSHKQPKKSLSEIKNQLQKQLTVLKQIHKKIS